MEINDFYKNELGIDLGVTQLVNNAQTKISGLFENIESLYGYHQARILKFMGQCRISQRHFQPTTGYGYGDEGREQLDKLFALVFGGQDALVRPHWVSGTHVLSDSLFALLRPGDTLLSICGKPYDTLEETIGINGSGIDKGTLNDWGISYHQIDLTKEGKINLEEVVRYIDNQSVKLVLIQRSRGYEWRPSLSVREIGDAIDKIKAKKPEILVLVDNCYGEFTEKTEPSHCGADLVVGSLIKNPGGGLAPTGAYAVGTKAAVEKLSYRLTSPAIGREVGSYSSSYMPFYQGLFMAPHVVAEAMKGAILAAKVFEDLGYKTLPKWNENRSDIIQSIQFNTADELITFCQGIQEASPVDGHVVPYPWDMPGYSHKVIMAAGTFIQGASIELSADAPIREPYIAYIQGGLTYAHAKTAIMTVVNKMKNKGFISI